MQFRVVEEVPTPFYLLCLFMQGLYPFDCFPLFEDYLANFLAEVFVLFLQQILKIVELVDSATEVDLFA